MGHVDCVCNVLFRFFLGDVCARCLILVMLGVIFITGHGFIGRFVNLGQFFVSRSRHEIIALTRSETPQNVSVTHTHSDDLFIRPLGGAKKIVRHNRL